MGVDHQLTRSGFVQSDKCPGVVDQHLFRHPIPEAECFLQRLQSVALLLMPVHPDHLPPGVPQGGTQKGTLVCTPPIGTYSSPKSACNSFPGQVS